MSSPERKYPGSCCAAPCIRVETDLPSSPPATARSAAQECADGESPRAASRCCRATTRSSEYRFHTMTARHYFCKTCGYPFHRKRVTPDHYGINVFCLDGFDPSGIPVRRPLVLRWIDDCLVGTPAEMSSSTRGRRAMKVLALVYPGMTLLDMVGPIRRGVSCRATKFSLPGTVRARFSRTAALASRRRTVSRMPGAIPTSSLSAAGRSPTWI